MYFYTPPSWPGPVPSPTAPLTQEQIALVLKEALQWEQVKTSWVHDFVARFEATWGPLTLATLLRVAQHFAPDRLSDAAGSEPAPASVPPELALPVEVVGTQTFVVAKDSVVALAGLGRALHQRQQRAQATAAC